MRRTTILLIVVCAALAGAAMPCAATTINLDLYNSEPLLDSDASTPLQGTTSGGDLVQVLLLGADNTINPLDSFGNPTGDDTLLFVGDLRLHVGYGMPFDPNAGWLDVFPLQYDSALVGSNIFVRFYNAATLGAATYYGNSGTFTLPVGTGPGGDQAALDFVPDAGSPHVTDQPILLTVIPEPSNLFLFGMMVWGVRVWRKRAKFGTA